jgi:N-acetylneuraminate synthase
MAISIIAEIGSVHDGSFGNALRLIEAAAACGADAVKFQTHIAAAETLRDAPMPPFFTGEPRYDYFERTGFRLEQWQALKNHCEHNHVAFLSSPFSIDAVELLELIGVVQYKIPSGEVTNLPLLEHIARTGKPVLLSSGMSSWAELDAAVNTILRHHQQVVVLQCTSAYPCPYEQVGLNVLQTMRERYQLPVGLSDHTLTNYAAFAAAVLGATVIEKHFTFSRLMYGSDAKHSLEPPDFTDLAQGIRAIETMLATPVNKDDVAPFVTMKTTFEKSIVALVAIPAGTRITAEMVGLKKPGTGIPARRMDAVVGKVARRDIPDDTLIQDDDLDNTATDDTR